MTPPAPRWPLAAMALWLATVTDLGALVLLWLSNVSIVVKALVTAVLVFGMCMIIAFHFGRRYEWKDRLIAPRGTRRRPDRRH